MFSDIQGASSSADFMNKLAEHGLIDELGGNPGLIKATAPRLSGHTVDTLCTVLRAPPPLPAGPPSPDEPSPTPMVTRAWSMDDVTDEPTPPRRPVFDLD